MLTKYLWGLKAEELDCGHEASEFKFQSHYFINIWTDTLGKCIEPPLPSCYWLNSTITVRLQGYIWL